MASTPTCPTRRHRREDAREDVGVLCDFPVQFATRLPDWSAGGLLRCSAAHLSVCRVVLQNSTGPTRTICCGHTREDHSSILVRHVRHARFPSDMLATSSRVCYEENAPVEFQLIGAVVACFRHVSS